MQTISLIASFSFCCLLLLLAAELEAKRSRYHSNRDDGDTWMSDEARARISRKDKAKPRRSSKPNIVMIITDDQDVELGSLNYMPKLQRLLNEGGATFENSFVTTPMCCPSRSSMLTGMYVHNHNTYTNNDNCSSPQWQQQYETRNFGVYLSNAGYRTGYFGKYLNEYKGTHIPPGWSEWVGLVRNTRFYNYTLNFNGKKIKHGDNYYKDYLTDLIANDSVTFLKQSKQYFPNRPVAMVLSMPAPHGPEDSAPQYQHLFKNVTTHHTPSWNYAPNPDKQWILQHTGKMEPIHVEFVNMLQQKRLQTLQSVDDALEKVYHELKRLGELDNTYIIYTSDHGYHLGQYGLLKGKAMPYEFDIKVPFLMRGPGIPARVRVPNMVINLDIAPTLLDIAGVPTPPHMDGRSILKLFENVDEKGSIIGNALKRKKAWRDTFLVERGKITTRKLIERERLEAMQNRLIETKEQRLVTECSKAEYQPPCSGEQQWYCSKNENGRLRMYKCRHNKRHKQNHASSEENTRCVCPPSDKLKKNEKDRQRKFLMDHVTQPKQFRPKFIRQRRDLTELAELRSGDGATESMVTGSDASSREEDESIPYGESESAIKKEDSDFTIEESPVGNVEKKVPISTQVAEETTGHDLVNQGHALDPNDKDGDLEPLHKEHVLAPLDEDHKLDPIEGQELDLESRSALGLEDEMVGPPELKVVDLEKPIFGEDLLPQSLGVECQVLENNTVVCGREVYESFDSWKRHKNALDTLIQEYRERLDSLKDVRKHLRQIRPLVVEEEAKRTGSDRLPWQKPVGTLPEPNGAPWSVGSGWEHSDFVDEEVDGAEMMTGQLENGECICPSDEEREWDAEEFLFDKELSEPSLSKREKLKLERTLKREERRRERLDKKKNKKNKKGRKNKEVTKDCNSPNMKCFTHEDDHWKTAPLWNFVGSRSSVKSGKMRDLDCHVEGVECHYMDDYHWRTAPRWTLGPFCFCPNSNNNTYWCLRTINETHNFLYCEFITGFISFYDMTVDPYQLRNVIHDLDYGKLQQLSKTLGKLKRCKGQRECTIRTRPTDDEPNRKNRDGEWVVDDNETLDDLPWTWRAGAMGHRNH